MNTSAPRDTPFALAGRLAALIAGGAVAVRGQVDPDLWGHLRFGLDAIASRSLPSVDPYSFTQDVPWINHEWLSEVMLGLAWHAGGTLGLTVLKAAVVGIAFLLMAAAARAVPDAVRGWALAIAFINIAPVAGTFRPQMWTILGLSLLCFILSGRARLWWTIPLFAVWANMHGGWIVGAGVAALWGVGRVIDTRKIGAHLPTAAVLVAAVAATIATPYGWRLWEFLFNTVRLSRADISEWRPYWEQFVLANAILLPLALGLFGATVMLRWRHVSFAWLLPALWLAVNAVMVSRLAAMFGEVAFFAIAAAWSTPVLAQPSMPAVPGRWIVDAVAVASLALLFGNEQRRCLPIPDEWKVDLLAASAFEPPEVRGRLMTPFDFGEFAIWHWGPRLKVSIDGRRETVYSEDTVRLQQGLIHNDPAALAFVERVRPEYAWLTGPLAQDVADRLTASGYTVDVRTALSAVARRSDLPALHVGPPLTACFP